jgi:MSHA biogenesis protein MshO
MTTTMRASRSNKGFTIVELIVAIVISGIIAAFIGLFITTPVDNYFAQSRRAELVVESGLIQRNINSDIRNAVPNSIRVINSGTVKIIELLYAVDVARYREAGTSQPPAADDELDFSTTDNKFSTIGRFNKIALPCCAPGYRLVINQNQAAGQDAYRGDKSITPSGTVVTISNDVNKKISNVTLSAAFQFASTSPTRHVFLTNGPVAYVCDQNAHTIIRYANYPVSSTIAGNRNSTTNIGTVSRDISTCNFGYTPSTSSRADLVSAEVQLQRNGEVMPVFIQSAVENMP